MNSLLDPINSYIDESDNKSYGDILPLATPNCRASEALQPISPLPEKKLELMLQVKHGHTKNYTDQTPPPPPPPPPAPSQSHRGSADLVSPLHDRKCESSFDVQVPVFVQWWLVFSLINIPNPLLLI